MVQKHKDPTNYDSWYPPYIGPWKQKVRSLCLCGLLGPYIEPYNAQRRQAADDFGYLCTLLGIWQHYFLGQSDLGLKEDLLRRVNVCATPEPEMYGILCLTLPVTWRRQKKPNRDHMLPDIVCVSRSRQDPEICMPLCRKGLGSLEVPYSLVAMVDTPPISQGSSVSPGRHLIWDRDSQ